MLRKPIQGISTLLIYCGYIDFRVDNGNLKGGIRYGIMVYIDKTNFQVQLFCCMRRDEWILY